MCVAAEQWASQLPNVVRSSRAGAERMAMIKEVIRTELEVPSLVKH